MRVAAIDAYVKKLKDYDDLLFSSSFKVYRHSSGNFPNGYYEYQGHGGNTWIFSRPDYRGQGGGEAHRSGTFSWEEGLHRAPDKDIDLDGVRRRIDRALEKFWELPATGTGNDDSFGPGQDVANQLASVAAELGLDDSPLAGANARIETLAGRSDGKGGSGSSIVRYTSGKGFICGAFRNFNENIVFNLSAHIETYSRLAIWIATAVASQARGWHYAKANVARAVDNARTGFEHVAHRSGSLDPFQAKFYKGVIYAAENFLPDALSNVTSAFEISDYLGGAIDDAVPAPGDSYDDVMKAFENAMNKIASDIKIAEGEMASAALELLEYLYQHRANYVFRHDGPGGDLTIDADMVGGIDLDLDYDVVRTVAGEPDGIVPEIATILSDQASIVSGLEDQVRHVFRRSSGIGIGAYGPADSVGELVEVLWELLNRASWACTESAQAVMAAYWYHARTNDKAAADLRERFPEVYQAEFWSRPSTREALDAENRDLEGVSSDRPFDYNVSQIRERMEQS